MSINISGSGAVTGVNATPRSSATAGTNVGEQVSPGAAPGIGTDNLNLNMGSSMSNFSLKECKKSGECFDVGAGRGGR